MKCFTIVFLNFFIICLQVIVLILSLTFFTQFKTNSQFLSTILDNWGARPFKNIELFEKDCPFNYQPIVINRFSLSCNFDLERESLQEEKFNTSLLRNSQNQSFCIKKVTSFGYFKQTLKKKCNAQLEHDCGFLDTLGNRLCISKTKSCPLNGIAVRHNKEKKTTKVLSYEHPNLTSPSNHTYSFGAKQIDSLPINENYTLIFSRNNTSNMSTVVVEIDILNAMKQSNLQCNYLLPFEINSTLSKSHRLKIKREDTDSKEVSDLSLKSSLQLHSHNYSLEYRPFIGWKESCLKNKLSSPDQVEILFDRMNKIKENKEKLRFLNLIFSGIIICIVLVYFPLRCDIFDIWQYVYQIISCIQYMIFATPLLLTNIALCWKTLYSEEKRIDIFDCSDRHTNSKLIMIRNNISSVFYVDFALFFLSLLALTIPVILLSCLNSKEDHKEEGNENELPAE